MSGFPATTVTFTPTAGFSGTASFQFTLANAAGTSNTATTTITVLPPPPVAVDETTSTSAGVPVTIDLTKGATGGAATSATLIGTPISGTVSIARTTATFTPAAGFSGAASFQFTLSNAAGTSNTATASITVLGACGAAQIHSAKANALTAGGQCGAPAIIFNGADITNTTQTVVVGQQIQLSSKLPNSATAQKWNITGGPIGGYTPCAPMLCPTSSNPSAPQTGQIVPLGNTTQNSITYYWINATTGTQTYAVTYNYTLSDGTSGTLQANFSVSPAPPTTAQAKYGTVGTDWIYIDTEHNNDETMGFGNPFDGNVGIRFTVLTSPGNGVYEWVQLVYVDEAVYITSNKTHICISSGGLDKRFPFPNNDSPSFDLAGKTAVGRVFAAQTYLMWQSNIANSIPVPLGFTNWGFRELSRLTVCPGTS